jgi:hypothetical protein
LSTHFSRLSVFWFSLQGAIAIPPTGRERSVVTSDVSALMRTFAYKPGKTTAKRGHCEFLPVATREVRSLPRGRRLPDRQRGRNAMAFLRRFGPRASGITLAPFRGSAHKMRDCRRLRGTMSKVRRSSMDVKEKGRKKQMAIQVTRKVAMRCGIALGLSRTGCAEGRCFVPRGAGR